MSPWIPTHPVDSRVLVVRFVFSSSFATAFDVAHGQADGGGFSTRETAYAMQREGRVVG
jgi:hypothetical protein